MELTKPDNRLITPDVEKKVLGPALTNHEVKTRTDSANRLFENEFFNQRQNLLVAEGGLAKQFGLTHLLLIPDSSSEQNLCFDPHRGNLRIMPSQWGYISKETAKNIFSLDDCEVRLSQAVSLLKEQGIPASFFFEENEPKYNQGEVNSYTKYKRKIYLFLGESPEEGLKEILTLLNEHYAKKDDDGALYYRYLQQKRGVIISLGEYNKTEWEKPIKMGSKFITTDYSYDETFINVPYTSEFSLERSIDWVQKSYEVLIKCGILPAGDLPQPPYSVRFNLPLQSVDAKVPLSPTEYETLIALKKSETGKSSDVFNIYFRQDRDRIKSLSYQEAIEKTRREIPRLLENNGDLITRAEICTVSRTQDGRLVFLLPAEDYLPLDPTMGGYQNPMHHERIRKTWEEAGRKEALDQLTKTDIRGYYLETATELRFIILDKDTALESKITEAQLANELKDNYHLYDPSELLDPEFFNRMDINRQILLALEKETALLKIGGVSSSDITFYSYWYQRLYIDKDADKEAIYEGVEEKFDRLKRIIVNERVGLKAK